MTAPLKNLPDVSPTDKTVAVLAVTPHEQDHVCLRAIFRHSNWRISAADTCHEAMSFLGENQIAVLVCERDLPDGDWRTVLDSLSTLPLPPLVVVTAPDAEDALWAEVLNLGAYDVLSKPFERTEVMRVISLAWRHWKDQSRRRLRKPADRTSGVAGSQRSGSATA